MYVLTRYPTEVLFHTRTALVHRLVVLLANRNVV